jgi:CO/xanthine dehydrogenase Mo-binding subunit
VLAGGETKYFGEPVAAVAAESEDAAEAAAALVRVEYEELPAVLSIASALDPASPLVQDLALRPNDPLNQTNIMGEWKYGWGNVEECRVERVIEHVYTFPMVTHFAIEPFAFLAAPEKDGVVIWSAIQHPYVLQRVIAALLNLSLAKVRVIAPDPGGGFGGKGYPKFEPLAAFLALKTGQPVRLALTLEESFQAVRRAASQVRLCSGFSADGQLVFQDVEANFLIGAYVDIAARVAGKASYVACGPYRVPHARIIGRALFSHTTPSTAFRGFGIPQLSWALESQMDQAARELGIDRVEIRLRNLPDKGEFFIPGDTPVDGNWTEAVQKAAAAIGWGQPLAKGHGRGLAIGLKNSATVAASYTIIRLHYDGSVSVIAGTSDMGQGARTIFSQLVAEELGLPLEQITLVMGDTATVPFDVSTSASRSAVFMGNAILTACQDIKAQLKKFAVEAFGLSEAEVTVESGAIHLPDRALAYAEFLREYFGPVRGEVIAVGSAPGRICPRPPARWENSLL